MHKKVIAGLLAFGLAGCYGPFRLTTRLYNWNGNVGAKWANELAFLGLNVIPVYSFAALADAIVFNSIEFWGGKNPMSARRVSAGGEAAVLSLHGDRLRIDSFQNGRVYSTLLIERSGPGLRATDAEGRPLMSARNEGGTLVVEDATGRVVARQPRPGARQDTD